MANIRDVAAIAGVSPSTVSRVLSGSVRVSEIKRNRVYQAVAELHYDIDKSSQKGNPGDSKLGIVIPKHAAIDLAGHPAFSTAISSFEEEVKQQGRTSELILLDEQLFKNFAILAEREMDAYFILGTNEEQEDILLPYLRDKHLPYIILNRWVNDKFINYVNIDDAVAAQQATEYLIQLKHEKMAFIGGNKNFRNSRLRIKGFEIALEKAGLPVNPQYILQGEYTEAYGYQVGDELFAMNDRPTAALVSSDIIAAGLQRKLRELGMKLPEDFSMVGWGDFTIASYVTPALTTIRMPTSEMGTQAAIALDNMIRYPDVMGTHILMKAPLIVRDSCVEI